VLFVDDDDDDDDMEKQSHAVLKRPIVANRNIVAIVDIGTWIAFLLHFVSSQLQQPHLRLPLRLSVFLKFYCKRKVVFSVVVAHGEQDSV
jgi:hypothetical protein